MFLDDISRKINKQKKGWERWDDHRTLDLEGYQTVVNFVGDIALLCVKNVGDVNVAIEMKGLQTRLSKGEEKYFTKPAGRQVIVHVKEPGGRVFIGQSYKGDITSNTWLCFIMIALLCAGCVRTSAPEDFQPKPFTAPRVPTAPSVPQISTV